jgi:hypothetical protein
VADEFAEIRDMRERYLKAAYRHRQRDTGMTSRDDIMPDLGLDPDVPYGTDDDTYVDLTSHWVERGYVKGVIDGYGCRVSQVRILPGPLPEGIPVLEGARSAGGDAT